MHAMHAHAAIGRDPKGVKGKQLNRTTVRRVLDFARPYRGWLAGFVITLLLSSLLSIVPALIVREIIDDAIPNSDGRRLNMLALFIVAIAVFEAILAFIERWWSARIGEGVIFDLRVQLFDHVQRMPVAFFTHTQTGSLISRMNNDVIGAQRALTGTLGQVISNVIILTTTLVAMFIIEWRLPLLALLLLPAFLIPTKRVGRTLQGLTRRQMEHNASMNNTMTERLNVAGAMLVKLFGRHDDETTQFAERAGAVRDLGIRSALYGRAFTIGLTLVGAIGGAIVYWVGGHLAIRNTISVGTIVAMGLYVVRIYLPLTGLTNARVDIMTAFVSFERVFEVLDTPNPIVDAPDAVDLVDPLGQVAFDNVTFAYPTDTGALASLSEAAPSRDAGSGPVIQSVDLTIEPGELVALVGPSGAGKTTLASLVSRLYDVDDGAVKLDDVDVRRISQASLREAIGVVSQDPHLFHDTVGNNLRYAMPNASDDELRAACASAQILKVIDALPNGFDTVVGERGYRLSGGEKQRLAIARVLLKQPAIVVLDEATSHLDSENEALVQAALTSALDGRTAIVIAHRLSTITAADKIAVLDEGKIVELGQHDDLLAARGLYFELYETLVGRDRTGLVEP